MFCHKCGAQIAEGAVFCHKCGTKAVYGGDAAQPAEQATVSAALVAATAMRSTNAMTNQDNFKAFVNSHIQATTQFQSVDDLINNSKPTTFVWFWLGALSLLGLILGAINLGGMVGALMGLLLMGGFIGYAVVFIVSGVIRKQYRDKFYGEFEQEINIEDFLVFLDGHLKTLSPYFHECGYLDQRGGLLTSISNAVADVFKEVTLCCVCGPKKKSLATISIRPHVKNPDSGRKQYIVGAVYRGFLIDGRAAGFLGHACLIRTAPVLQAAMKYYLKHYKNN